MTKHSFERKMPIPDISDSTKALHFTFDKRPSLKLKNPPKTFGSMNYHNEINKNDDYLSHESNVLPQEMIEIEASMKDWECYMYCKEHEERWKVLPVTDTPIRNCDRADNVIRFTSQKYRSDAFTYSKIEIRPREECWNGEVNKEEESNKILQAKAEKVRGNEAYRSKNYIKACEHYSNCIALVQMPDAYNNRAQANMKLKNYSSALSDLNEVLNADPLNEKGLFRRATCKREMRMYNEALEDAQTMLQKIPDSKEAMALITSIKKEMAKLNGKAYRIRENFGARKTFDIDVSQLPVYATCENDYLIEVDKTGCAKSCVCNYCIAEDRRTRFKSTSLRIKERHRWKQLTLELLDEMRISSPITTVSKDLKEIQNNEKPANSIELVNGDTNNVHDAHKMGRTVDQSIATNYLNELNEFSFENEKNDVSINLSSCNTTIIETEPKSIKNRKNLRDQQSEHIEDLFSSMHLDSFKNIPPSSLKKRFDSRLDEETLTNMIKFVCQLYQSKTEWSLISEYLSSIAALERFKIIIHFVNEKTKNDLNLLLNEAISLNLKNATQLKLSYFSH